MTCLPFGLSSSCLIYTLFADAVEWIVIHHSNGLFNGICNNKPIKLLRHYIDDFIGGNENQNIAIKQFNSLIYWFNKLNIPTRDSKCKYPAFKQQILGSIFNTVTQTYSLPTDKCKKYSIFILEIIQLVKQRKRIYKKTLQKLNGRLRFAARHIWCGQTFCRALEERINNTKDGDCTRLNKQIISDLQWWLTK